MTNGKVDQNKQSIDLLRGEVKSYKIQMEKVAGIMIRKDQEIHECKQEIAVLRKQFYRDTL